MMNSSTTPYSIGAKPGTLIQTRLVSATPCSDDRPQHRADHGAGAADHRHQQHLHASLRPEGDAGVDVEVGLRVQHAAQRRQAAGQRQRQDLRPQHHDAEGAGRVLVLPHRDQLRAEPAAGEPARRRRVASATSRPAPARTTPGGRRTGSWRRPGAAAPAGPARHGCSRGCWPGCGAPPRWPASPTRNSCRAARPGTPPSRCRAPATAPSSAPSGRPNQGFTP